MSQRIKHTDKKRNAWIKVLCKTLCMNWKRQVRGEHRAA